MDQLEDGLEIENDKGLWSKVFNKYQDIYQRVIRVEKVLNESKTKNTTTAKKQRRLSF